VFVGYRGSQNLVIVTTNGSVEAMDAVIGIDAGARCNGLVVSGEGAVWSNRYGVTVGQAGDSNALYVINGAQLHSQYGELGATRTALANYACVGGLSGSAWILDNYLAVGNGGGGNRLDLMGGGKVEDAFGLIGVGHTACSNFVSVSDAGTLWSNSQRLCVGVDGAGNRLEVRQGGLVNCSALVIGDYSLATSNEVTIEDAGSAVLVAGDLIVGADGAHNRLIVKEGASVVCGRVIIGQYASAGGNELVLSGAGASLTVSNSAGLGAINILNGKLRTDGGSLTAGSVLVGPGGQVESLCGASNVTLHLGGDFGCGGTNRALALLGVTVAFSTSAVHRLDVNSRDQGASLQGFVDNRALGRLEVGGAVTVTNVCYAWELSGSGAITVAEGAVFYYAGESNWTGSINVQGSGRFARIPVMLNSVLPLTNDFWRVGWHSASGLSFSIEWGGSLLEPDFLPATNLMGTGADDAWVDTGGDGRPAPGLVTGRFYRLKVWPVP
jgi:T5SS/PEP-CTERM-associated repeat protein